MLLIPSLIFLSHVHEVLDFNILVDDLDLGFGTFKHSCVVGRVDLHWHSDLTVILSIDQCDQG